MTTTIGTNITRLRQHQRITQAALAQAMRYRGHTSWVQTIVWRTESDQRRLRPDEARSLIHLLGNIYADTVEAHLVHLAEQGTDPSLAAATRQKRNA